MLIITGTGRCGTSLMAEFCTRLGYPTGGDWIPRINAGRETPEVVAINNGIAAARRAGKLEQFLAESREAMLAVDRPVVKDPRFVSLETTRHWLTVRSDLRFLLLYRDVNCAVASSRKYLKLGDERQGTLSDHAALARRQLLAFADAVRDAAPTMVLRFPELLSQFGAVYTALTAFGGLQFSREAAMPAWNALVDERRVHFSFSDTDEFYPVLMRRLVAT